MRHKFLLSVLSITITLVVIELCFRLFYPINLQGWYGELLDNEKKFFALKKNHSHKTDRWNYKYAPSYKIGEYRNRITRNIKDLDISKNKRILILGDSFTFGLYLKDEHTYMDKLQKKFSRFYLVNSSTPGWGLEDYNLFLKSFCSQIKPEKIIIILNDGDLGRIRKKAIYIAPTALKDKNFFYKFLIENFMLVAFLRDNLYKLKKTLFLKKNNLPGPSLKDTSIKFDLKETLEIVRDAKKIFFQIKDQSLKCKAELNIIYLGWGSKKKDIDLAKYPTQYFIKEEKKFFYKNSIKFYNNSKSLLEVHNNKNKYIIKNEGHPNEMGAQMIYESLEKYFMKILN